VHERFTPTGVLLVALLLPVLANSQTLRVRVDLTDAPQNLFHTAVTLPASPGPMTLVYPKWIPGNHRPSGPIANVAGLHIRSGGQEIPWKRDPVEMYSFHVEVPKGAREVEAVFDLIATDSAGAGGNAASSNLLDLNWNQVVLYPAGVASDAVQCSASVRLPKGWKYGTALEAARTSGDEIEFSPVSLTTLVDSPLIAGVHYREVELTTGGGEPRHKIDIVADDDPDLEMSAADVTAYKKLVAEAGTLFGARHYRHYDFLLTLTSVAGHHGVEHHESSDNSAAERMLTDPTDHELEAALMPHEFVHSWNGKYRRPAGLATRNYQEPMIGDLLWVYEGLTEYLGNVLTARSGLWTPEQYRDALAFTAANMEARVGRTWRPLEDTGISVQTLRMLGPQWSDWRRSLDYYPEGGLIWLEVDATLREQTNNQESMDDFCRRFHGGESGPPKVVPYTFEEIVKTLNEITPYDWGTLLKDRVQKTANHAPLGGIERGGWRVAYTDKPNSFDAALEGRYKFSDLTSSLGILLDEKGKVIDAVPGLPAFKAGIGPGMSILAVDGRKWSGRAIPEALQRAKQSKQPMELIVENGNFYKTYSIPYFEGSKYAHLERVEGMPDRLTDIIKARTGETIQH
jgi:predicted metalloprotease with PDZ domain